MGQVITEEAIAELSAAIDQGHSTNHQISLPEGPELSSGTNQSNPIWHLVYISAFNLVTFFAVGVFLLYGYLPKVHPTYLKVMHIMIFGVPIALAASSLLISCWLACDLAGRGSLIEGLLVANYSMYGVLPGLLAFKHGTGN